MITNIILEQGSLEEYQECYDKLSPDKIKNINAVILNHCNFEQIPKSISNFQNLIKLNLFQNKIEELSSNLFQKLVNLKHLVLQNNYISYIPEDIFQNCQKLIFLSLSGNTISELPPNIFANLNNLRDLFFRRNLIKKLPVKLFRDLNNLEKLWICRNPIKYYISDNEKQKNIEIKWFKKYLRIVLPNTSIFY